MGYVIHVQQSPSIARLVGNLCHTLAAYSFCLRRPDAFTFSANVCRFFECYLYLCFIFIFFFFRGGACDTPARYLRRGERVHAWPCACSCVRARVRAIRPRANRARARSPTRAYKRMQKKARHGEYWPWRGGWCFVLGDG